MKALPEQKQIRKLWSRIRGNIMENRRFQWLLSLVIINICMKNNDGLLTPSRPTCVGDIVEYNCSIVDTALQWNYNGRLINFFSSQGIGFSNPRIISGIAFNTLYTPSDGVIISTVRFEANEISNNLQIICSRLNPSNTFSDNIKILNFSDCLVSISLISTAENSVACPNEDVNITCSSSSSHFFWRIFNLRLPVINGSTGSINPGIPGVVVYIMRGVILSSTVEINRDSTITSTMIICESSDSQTLNISFQRELGPFLAPTNFELLNEVIEAPTRRTVQVMWDHTSETQTYKISCLPKVCSTRTVNNTHSATIVINSLDAVTLILSAINICVSNSTFLNLNRIIFPISRETTELISTQEYIHTSSSDVSTVSASDTSLIVATNISSFLIGLVVGISAASIVLLCIWRIKKRRGMSPSSHSVDCQPSQAYEDVDIVKVQDMQLQENVAYGQVKGL